MTNADPNTEDLICPSCDRPASRGKFCSSCGTQLQTRPAALPEPTEASVTQLRPTLPAGRFIGAMVTDSYEEQRPSSFAPPAASFHPSVSRYAPQTEVNLGGLLTQFEAEQPTVQPPTEPATWGRRGTIRRLTGGIIKPAPGADELAFRAAEASIRQTILPRAAHIAVENTKGGACKTPTSVILSAALGRQRKGVVVWEAAEARGTLGRRTEGNPVRGIGHLVENIHAITSAGALSGYTAPQSSHADAIGTTADRPAFTGQDIARVQETLSQHFQLMIADGGNNAKASAFEQVISMTDVLIVPTVPTSDSIYAALDTLDAVSRTGAAGVRLAESAVLVVSHNGGPEDSSALERMRESVTRSAPHAVILDVPFDPHIAAGGPLLWDQLTPASQHAWTHVAAATIANLHRNITNGNG